jgi:hypothetical protein
MRPLCFALLIGSLLSAIPDASARSAGVARPSRGSAAAEPSRVRPGPASALRLIRARSQRPPRATSPEPATATTRPGQAPRRSVSAIGYGARTVRFWSGLAPFTSIGAIAGAYFVAYFGVPDYLGVITPMPREVYLAGFAIPVAAGAATDLVVLGLIVVGQRLGLVARDALPVREQARRYARGETTL